jgi:hypothetical protein
MWRWRACRMSDYSPTGLWEATVTRAREGTRVHYPLLRNGTHRTCPCPAGREVRCSNTRSTRARATTSPRRSSTTIDTSSPVLGALRVMCLAACVCVGECAEPAGGLGFRFGGQLYIRLRAELGEDGQSPGGSHVGRAPGRCRRLGAQAGLLLHRECTFSAWIAACAHAHSFERGPVLPAFAWPLTRCVLAHPSQSGLYVWSPQRKKKHIKPAQPIEVCDALCAASRVPCGGDSRACA